MPLTAGESQHTTRERLKRARADLEAARTARVGLVQEADRATAALQNANHADKKITEWPEFAAAEEAKAALSRCDGRVEVLRDELDSIISALNPDQSGTASADWLDADTMSVLEQMASSKMPVGRVALGTAVSVEDLQLRIGWASASRMAVAGETDLPDGVDGAARAGVHRGQRWPYR